MWCVNDLGGLFHIRQAPFPAKIDTPKPCLGSAYGQPIRPLWLALGDALTAGAYEDRHPYPKAPHGQGPAKVADGFQRKGRS